MKKEQDNNDNRKYKVYVYTNKINNKKYVGQTCRSLKERAGKDGKLYKNCVVFNNAIQKYGWDSFEGKIVFNGLTKTEANHYERLLIQILRTQNHDYGYNIDAGGNDNTYNSINITGRKFGRWTALYLVPTPSGAVGRHWLCQCDCGSPPKIIRQCNLTRGSTKSCGCLSKEINSQSHPNPIIETPNGVIIILNNNVKILVDGTSYNSKLNKFHLYYDTINRRILTSHDENIYRIIFPFIKRNKIKYVHCINHKNGNIFDFRKNNLELIIPDKISKDDYMNYLQDTTEGISIALNQTKKWFVRNGVVDNKQHSFSTYLEAKEYIQNKKEVV